MERLDRAIGTGTGGSVREAIAAGHHPGLRSKVLPLRMARSGVCQDGRRHSGVVLANARSSGARGLDAGRVAP